MHDVYLIPCGDRAYRAAISEDSPDPSAIFLTAELDYPAEVLWRRHDMNGDLVWSYCLCDNREELIEQLDFLGMCGHPIEQLWGYTDRYSPSAQITELFDICYARKMEELDAWFEADSDE